MKQLIGKPQRSENPFRDFLIEYNEEHEISTSGKIYPRVYLNSEEDYKYTRNSFAAEPALCFNKKWDGCSGLDVDLHADDMGRSEYTLGSLVGDWIDAIEHILDKVLEDSAMDPEALPVPLVDFIEVDTVAEQEKYNAYEEEQAAIQEARWLEYRNSPQYEKDRAQRKLLNETIEAAITGSWSNAFKAQNEALRAQRDAEKYSLYGSVPSTSKVEEVAAKYADAYIPKKEPVEFKAPEETEESKKIDEYYQRMLWHLFG